MSGIRDCIRIGLDWIDGSSVLVRISGSCTVDHLVFSRKYLSYYVSVCITK
jgi:hypothetical protein